MPTAGWPSSRIERWRSWQGSSRRLRSDDLHLVLIANPEPLKLVLGQQLLGGLDGVPAVIADQALAAADNRVVAGWGGDNHANADAVALGAVGAHLR